MMWLQENWIVAAVVAIVAIALLWWLFARRKPDEIAPPAAEPAKPAKPLEPARPDIVVAEPAFKKAPPASAAPIVQTPPPPTPPATAAIPEEPTAAAAPPAEIPVAATEPVATPETPALAPAIAPAAPEEPAAPAPAPAAKADNLQLLKGVGPKLAALLGGLGVTRFQQIADWTDTDIAAIDPQLGAFQGRIARDNLVDQAGYLARGDKPGFEAKYGALGGEL